MKSEKKNVVLDTNIIISAAIHRDGAPAQILRFLVAGKIINYTTKDIIEELVRVFDKATVRKFMDYEDKKLVLDGYISKSAIIKSEFDEKVVLDDPSDDKFINCALTAKATIVSGDSHLLRLKSYKGVKIISAKEFLKSLKR